MKDEKPAKLAHLLPEPYKNLYVTSRNAPMCLGKMQELFVNDAIPLKLLCQHFGYPFSELDESLRDRWKELRALKLQARYDEIKQASSLWRSAAVAKLEQGAEFTIDILLAQLEKIRDGGEELTFKELDVINKIHDRINYHLNLKKGEATSITKKEDEPTSVSEINEVLKRLAEANARTLLTEAPAEPEKH